MRSADLLLTSVDFTLNAHTSPAGTAVVDLRMPDDASWIGTEFFQQFAVLDLAANALGLAASQGGAATIGAR